MIVLHNPSLIDKKNTYIDEQIGNITQQQAKDDCHGIQYLNETSVEIYG